MEHKNDDDIVYGTIHRDANGYTQYGGTKNVSAIDDFHIYSVEWTPDSIKWFVDGSQYLETNIKNSINDTDEFHKPFFLLLNLAVGGNWPGNPDARTVFPAEYKIDYIRVYQDEHGMVTQKKSGASVGKTKSTGDEIATVGDTFDHGVTNTLFRFKPRNWTAASVILHYTIPGANQENVNMKYINGTARWEYKVGQLTSGQAVKYSFTYKKDASQYDTEEYQAASGAGGI